MLAGFFILCAMMFEFKIVKMILKGHQHLPMPLLVFKMVNRQPVPLLEM
jgi:hypothetical protein